MSAGTSRRLSFANVTATFALAISLAGGAALALDSIQGEGRIFHEQLRIPAGDQRSWRGGPFKITYRCPATWNSERGR